MPCFALDFWILAVHLTVGFELGACSALFQIAWACNISVREPLLQYAHIWSRVQLFDVALDLDHTKARDGPGSRNAPEDIHASRAAVIAQATTLLMFLSLCRGLCEQSRMFVPYAAPPLLMAGPHPFSLVAREGGWQP